MTVATALLAFWRELRPLVRCLHGTCGSELFVVVAMVNDVRVLRRGDGKATSTEQTLTDAIFNQIKSEQENAEPQSLSRSASYVNEEREPPPLFDDGDDDDDNLDWLSK